MRNQPVISIGPHWYLTIVALGMIAVFGYVLINLVFFSTSSYKSWIAIVIYILDFISFLICALKN